ncbi:MAG: glycerophosphodiester phosphodiesterase [Burkholderiaceae bacterium]
MSSSSTASPSSIRAAWAAVGRGHWPYPRWIAHRGGGRLAPENTLAAMRVGAARGYRMFEFDAKLSGDGTLILMHDDTLDRTTSGRARVSARALGDMMKLDAGSWFSPEFAGEGIPTLWRVGTWLIANGSAGNIEIKPCPGREAETGAAVAIEAACLWQSTSTPPLLSSFSPVALDAARRCVPELPRALLLDAMVDDWLDRCRALDCVAVDVQHRLLTADFIAAAHAAGLKVLCYTMNDPARGADLCDWGIDGMITDRIDALGPS